MHTAYGVLLVFVLGQNVNLHIFLIHRLIVVVFIFLYFPFFFAHDSKVYKEKVVIIPGTWATQVTWYRPGGDFYDVIAQEAQKKGFDITWFSWSGELGYDSSLLAAKKFVCNIELDTCQIFHIIAHSRGAHVAAIASQILTVTKSEKKIGALYLLGAPIDQKIYMPDMNSIDRIYNLYSTSDIVQPILGLFHQCFDSHERIANLRVLFETLAPDHFKLHDPIIGRYILDIHDGFGKQKSGNFENFRFDKPGVINFFVSRVPTYNEDFDYALHWRNVDQKRLIEKEESL